MDVLAEKKVKLAACGEEHMGCLVLHGWVPDDEAQHCMACKKSFTTIRRRVSNCIGTGRAFTAGTVWVIFFKGFKFHEFRVLDDHSENC